MIRCVNPQTDADQIMDIARDLSQRASGGLVPDDPVKFASMVYSVLALPGLQILVMERQDRIVGAIGVLYAPYHWNPEITVADGLFWWAAKDAPFGSAYRLFTEAMNRVRQRGALPMFHALRSASPGIDRLYRKLGLVPIETVYAVLP